MNREEIQALLPHRAPMLLVDSMELCDGKAIGTYAIRGDEFFLQGHFPGNPVVPGVILCEIMAQSCVLLLGDSIAGKTPYYMGIDKVRFKAPVRPGDVVRVTAEITRNMGAFFFTWCRAENQNSQLICQGELSFALVDERK